jgi:hypothetical protein
MKRQFFCLAIALVALCGCRSYVYRVVQPAGVSETIADKTVTVRYDPLEYRLVRHKDRLAMRVINPTTDRVILDASRSFVVDPEGESHPIRGHILGPRSYTRMLIPPVPFMYAYPDYYWGWGWGWGPYDPFWGPYYGPGFYGPPAISYARVISRYDWTWKTGPARLHFTYERNTNMFEHEFEIVREPAKKHKSKG